MSLFDTIAAPITGLQPAAVAVIRMSGSESWDIAAKIFDGWPKEPESHRVYYGAFVTGDDGLALLFEEGRGYTGERSVELSIHGSPASVKALIDACIDKGARAAEPGEFTQRAFLNGRLDLTQAEGVKDTVEAVTDAQLRAANAMRGGEFHRKIEGLRQQALLLLAGVEASVDFSEEIGEFDRPTASTRVEMMSSKIARLLETARIGRLVRHGYRIAIVGPPNAGKSSLLNALLRVERSIVTEVPGTTRDYVEELADFDGYPVVLIDTAGLRETTDPVESIGIQRSRAAAANADEIWYVFDAAEGWSESNSVALSSFDRPVRVLANKSDLSTDAFTAPAVEALRISAKTGYGISTLVEIVKEEIGRGVAASFYINERHEQLLNEVTEALDATRRTLAADVPDDLLAVTLRQVVHGLGQITGESASADMVDEIFKRFCIGK